MKHTLTGRSVLIVDDEEDLRDMLSREFRLRGCQTFHAASGNEALAILKKTPMDVVVTDIRMPNGDGVLLLKSIKVENPAIPVVLLITGHADIEEADAYSLGAEALFSKPIDRKALVKAVTLALMPLDARWAPQGERMETGLSISLSEKGQAGSAEGHIVNVGRRGMFIELRGNLPGKDTTISFVVPHGKGNKSLIEGTGIVRWLRAKDQGGLPAGCGIEFLHLTDASRAEVIRLIEASREPATIPIR